MLYGRGWLGEGLLIWLVIWLVILLLISLLILICPPRLSQAEWSRCARGGAAGAAKGVGPRMALHADPWSGDVARGPAAQRRAKVGASVFGYFWGNAKSASRVRRETKRPANEVTKITTNPKAKAGAHSTPYEHPKRPPTNHAPPQKKSRTTKNPPKRVFLRPFQHPVGSHHGNDRSSLILRHSLCPSDSYRLSKPLQTEKAISEPSRVSNSL